MINTLALKSQEIFGQIIKGLIHRLGLEEKNYNASDKPYWGNGKYSHEIYVVFNEKAMSFFISKDGDITLFLEPNWKSFYPEYEAKINDLDQWPVFLDAIEKFFKTPFVDDIDSSDRAENKLVTYKICAPGLFSKEYGENTHLDNILDADAGKREYLKLTFPWFF